MMECTVYANKGIGLDLKLAGEKSIQIPAGGSVKTALTGDQVGHVEAFLGAQARAEKFGPDQAGGRVDRKVPPPPKDSKAYRALHPEEYVPAVEDSESGEEE